MTYAEFLIRKGKRGAAAFVQAECHSAKNEPAKWPPAHLHALLDHLLHPEKSINDGEMIDWCRWLVGGGSSYEDFAASGNNNFHFSFLATNASSHTNKNTPIKLI